MLLNEILDGMFDPRADKLVRELSNLFYKKWAPKLHDGNQTQYAQLMDKYKSLAAQHKQGRNVEMKLERLRDIVAHAAKQPYTDVKLRKGTGTYD